MRSNLFDLYLFFCWAWFIGATAGARQWASFALSCVVMAVLVWEHFRRRRRWLT